MTAEPVLYRRRALLDGITDPELRRARAKGRLINVAAGAYLTREQSDQFDAAERHRAGIDAAVHSHGGDVVVSHTSAAVLHGLDLGDVSLERVHLTRSRPSGGRQTPSVHVHTAPLDDEDVLEANGIRMTSIARTVVDVGCVATFDQAVVIGDSALRMGARTVDVNAVLDGMGPRKGVATARRVASFLDGLSESPGESLSRIRMRQNNIPAPQLQREIRTEAGLFVARTDFFWERWGVVGEFDGMCKYRGDQPGTVVAKEKQREDAIRDCGFEVVRWVWDDLWRFHVVRERFARACARAELRR